MLKTKHIKVCNWFLLKLWMKYHCSYLKGSIYIYCVSVIKVAHFTVEPFFLPIDAERSSIRADDASSVSSWSGTNNFSNLGNSSFTRDTSGTSLRESSISSHPEVIENGVLVALGISLKYDRFLFCSVRSNHLITLGFH